MIHCGDQTRRGQRVFNSSCALLIFYIGDRKSCNISIRAQRCGAVVSTTVSQQVGSGFEPYGYLRLYVWSVLLWLSSHSPKTVG